MVDKRQHRLTEEWIPAHGRLNEHGNSHNNWVARSAKPLNHPRSGASCNENAGNNRPARGLVRACWKLPVLLTLDSVVVILANEILLLMKRGRLSDTDGLFFGYNYIQ